MGNSLEACSKHCRPEIGVDLQPRPTPGSCKGSQQVYYASSTGLVYAAEGKSIVAHAASSGDIVQSYEGHLGPVTCLLLCVGSHEDCSMLFSGSIDTTVKCWDLNSCTVVATLEGHCGAVWALAQKSSCIFSCSEDCTITRWCQRRLVKVQSFKSHSPVLLILGLELDKLGVSLCSGSMDGTVQLWHDDGTLRHSMSHHKEGITCMILCNQQDSETAKFDGLLVGSRDGRISHWNLESGDLCKCLHHGDWVLCLLEALGSWWTGSRDSSIKRWDPTNGHLLTTLRGHQLGVNTLLHYSGSILSGSADRTVKQWHPVDEVVVASIQNLSGISSLLELPRGIFRTVNRGQAMLLAKPRPMRSEEAPQNPCILTRARRHNLFADNQILESHKAQAFQEFSFDEHDHLFSCLDAVPWERHHKGDIPPPHMKPGPRYIAASAKISAEAAEAAADQGRSRSILDSRASTQSIGKV